MAVHSLSHRLYRIRIYVEHLLFNVIHLLGNMAEAILISITAELSSLPKHVICCLSAGQAIHLTKEV